MSSHAHSAEIPDGAARLAELQLRAVRRDGVRAVAAPVRDPAKGAIAVLVARGDTADPPIP